MAYRYLKLCFAAIAVISMIVRASTQAASSRRGLQVDTHDITVLLNRNASFLVYADAPVDETIRVKLVKQHEALVELDPETFVCNAAEQFNQTVVVTGRQPGHLEVTASSVPSHDWITNELFVRIIVARSQPLITVSIVFGWMYFVAWSISFYPQMYINFRRKSVVGLNIDFVVLNLLGFTLYSMFNCGLFWIAPIQNEYAARHPRGLSPVLLNDVFFSLHALFATLITIIQCCIYERDGKGISKTASGLLGFFILFVLISAGLAVGGVIHWLDFLYYCSYVKLTITIIKYMPQALMNYRRKSTVGWSIGNILLDFTGSTLSILQMVLNAHNYDDWVSIFGDPTKFGLGFFSLLFDVFFMLQHYVFYRHSSVETSTPNLTVDTEAGTETQSETPK